MNVLSLFDGISCGQLALRDIGAKVNNYFASEIDTHAIKITQSHFPQTIQLGKVEDVNSSKLPSIDLLMGGSPCQGFSFSGKQLQFNDERSRLFFEFVRLLKECNPKYFLLENVVMKNQSRDVISQHLNVEPVLLDSALVSAQHRKRLYWTNIPLGLINFRSSLTIGDILEDVEDGDREWYNRRVSLKRRNVIQGDGEKARTLQTQAVFNTLLSEHYRYLTPLECERLQNLPDNYTLGIPKTHRYKAIGNGWTIKIISHILNGIKE